jgi:DNA-nicking Smr family endonuclease
MTAREKPPPEGDRFADLLGDAKPLGRGPARVAERPPAGSRPRPARSAGAGAATAAVPSFRHPDPESAHLAAAPGINDQQLARLRRGEPEPEERIDLHGTRREEAKRILAQRIESAVARALRCVVVVHGLGKRSPTEEAVLRDAVPGWLTRGALARHVLAFAPAPRRLGGDGATLVLLRKS